MNYNNTRQEAADKLGISIRSIDRYIKSGKLRAKKKGKIVFVNRDDLKTLKNGGKTIPEVIITQKETVTNNKNITDNTENIEKYKEKTALMGQEQIILTKTFEKVYTDLRSEVKNKDEIIQTLSIRVGKAEEVAHNSMSLVDFKKTQFLLEESKQNLNKEINNIKVEKEILEKELKYEKNTNIILIFSTILLLIVSIGFYIAYI